jgi:hypothetical protein
MLLVAKYWGRSWTKNTNEDGRNETVADEKTVDMSQTV